MGLIDEEGRLTRIDYGDRIYFDSIGGIAGATYPIGTAGMPSNVIANVITLCAARKTRKIDYHGALTLGAAMERYSFFGHCHESIADVLNLNGQDVDNSRFDNCVITGAQAGTEFASYYACILYNMSGFRGMAENCPIYGTLAMATGGAVDYADFDRCSSIHGPVTITLGDIDRFSLKQFRGNATLTGQTAGLAFVRGFEGELTIASMTGGTLSIFSDTGTVVINNTCVGGTINIYGSARVTNNGAGGCTVNNYTLDRRTFILQGGAGHSQGEIVNDYLNQELDLGLGDVRTLLMTGAEQELYSTVGAGRIYSFRGMFIDFTGLNAGGGESTTIKVYLKVDGVNYRIIYQETFLAAAVPSPAVIPIPRSVNTQCIPDAFEAKQDLRITVQQAAIGAGWNTLTYNVVDAKAGG